MNWKITAQLALILSLLPACGQFRTEKPEKPEKPLLATPTQQAASTEETPYFIKKAERETEIPSYSVPEPIRNQIVRENPEILPPESQAFQLKNPQLKIKVKEATMIFTGTLWVKNAAPERIELACKFDPAKSWICANMYPVSESIAKARRLQATVNCMDSYQCDEVGIELFVRINGKIESRFFQSIPFQVRRASSGDQDEGPIPVTETAPLTEKEVEDMIDDSNAAFEVEAPIPVPRPSSGEYSIPEIETYRPAPPPSQVPNQAVGAHNRGHLEKGAQLPTQGPGYQVRNGKVRSHGTNSMIESIQLAAAAMVQASPQGSDIVIADISNPTGGRLANRSGRFHASHQTGLDADIAFPMKNGQAGDLWAACSSGGGRCARGQGVSANFDTERFWTFASSMVCQPQEPVIAMFIDTEIKRHLCAWARAKFPSELNNPSSCVFKTLRAMKYEPGHHNHVHVRLKCPGNPDCRNATVSLGKGTGC